MGKSGPIATFNNLIFLWVGLALGWGVRRFHNNIYMFPNPTEFGKPHTPQQQASVRTVPISEPLVSRVNSDF